VEGAASPTAPATGSTRRSPATGAAPPSASEERAPDLQSLLSDALARLARATRCERACAWGWSREGELLVLAAHYRDGSPRAIGAEDRAALDAAKLRESERPQAFDLGAPRADAPLRALADRHGFGAGRLVRSREGEAVAVLWIGGSEDAPGSVRPRQLAHLDACAETLADPVSTLAAAARLRALDDEIRRLDRLSSLGDLLAEIVHEIRNPLVSVKTFLQLLPGREDDPEFTGEFREVVMDEMRRLERLLDSVVQHARPPILTADDEATWVGACLDSLAGLLRHRALDRDVVLESRVDEGLPPVALSQDVLRQLLLNLALNAIEVTPTGGRVVFSARRTGDGVEVRVDDDGPGVPPELRERIFQPFFSTRRERAGGLGLAISRRLAREAGGRLSVDDSASGGASFRAWLPAAAT
jgi:signal transduction histidine kinase